MDVNKSQIENSQPAIRKRIDDYIEYEALVSPTEFANKAGLDPSGIIKMLKGQMKITINSLRKISEAYGLSLSWLVLGEGEMYNNTNSPAPEISYTDGVPYYDVDFQLGFDEMEHPGAPNPEYLIRMPGYEKATLWCNASGHSMEPDINSGDILAMQRIEDFSFLPFGDIYGFITTNGMRTIKRLGRSDREGYYRLIPTNKDYDAQDIPIKVIAVVYRVLGAMKSF